MLCGVQALPGPGPEPVSSALAAGFFTTEPPRFLCNIALYSIRLEFHNQSHPELSIIFAVALSLHSFWSQGNLQLVKQEMARVNINILGTS